MPNRPLPPQHWAAGRRGSCGTSIPFVGEEPGEAPGGAEQPVGAAAWEVGASAPPGGGVPGTVPSRLPQSARAAAVPPGAAVSQPQPGGRPARPGSRSGPTCPGTPCSRWRAAREPPSARTLPAACGTPDSERCGARCSWGRRGRHSPAHRAGLSPPSPSAPACPARRSGTRHRRTPGRHPAP